MAARDLTRSMMDEAWAAAPRDPRMAQVRRAFNAGEASLGAGELHKALNEFREAYNQSERILGERGLSRSSR
jgi:hypothetical protein